VDSAVQGVFPSFEPTLSLIASRSSFNFDADFDDLRSRDAETAADVRHCAA
jgi:hypothetical protein